MLENLRNSPNSFDAHYKLANFYKGRKKWDLAAEHYEKAIDQWHENPDSYISLAWVYGQSGKHQQEIETWETFVQHFPQDARCDEVKKRIEYYRQEWKNISSSEAAGNPTEQQRRWPTASFPIKVYIPIIFSPPAYLDGAMELSGEESSSLMRKALEEWSTASDGIITFAYVTNPTQANIVCEWTSDTSQLHKDMAVGVTNLQAGAFQRKIFVLNRDYYNKNKPIDGKHFYEICLHECGHALGLVHSSTPGDIMYPSESALGQPLNGLSDNDIKRIRKLYSQQDR